MKKRRIPAWKYPKGIELSYKVYLRNFVRKELDYLLSVVKRDLPALCVEAKRERNQDSWSDETDNLMSGLEVHFDMSNNPSLIGFIKKVGARTISWNDKEWKTVLYGALNVKNVFYNDNYKVSYLKSFITENVSLISKLNQEALSDTRRIIESGIRSSDRWETIADDLEEKLGDKMDSRSELIARDQVSKFNGDLTETRQTQAGVEWYTWRTMEDDRVRDDHASLDGMLCKWEDDSVYSDDGGETWKDRTEDMFKGAPGEDFQCRCYPEPYLKELEEEEDKNA